MVRILVLKRKSLCEVTLYCLVYSILKSVIVLFSGLYVYPRFFILRKLQLYYLCIYECNKQTVTYFSFFFNLIFDTCIEAQLDLNSRIACSIFRWHSNWKRFFSISKNSNLKPFLKGDGTRTAPPQPCYMVHIFHTRYLFVLCGSNCYMWLTLDYIIIALV